MTLMFALKPANSAELGFIHPQEYNHSLQNACTQSNRQHCEQGAALDCLQQHNGGTNMCDSSATHALN
jgi:hypothetical protein